MKGRIEGEDVRGELPGLHDGGEPGVELLVRGDLVQNAAVDEPDFAGIAHD
jgi:hypothetical protein